MNQDKPRKMTNEQRAQRRRAALECTNNLNGSDSHYCPRCASNAQQAAVAPQAACADKRIVSNVVRSLGLGTRKKDFDADELLDLLRKLRDGAVTDSNRIGELSNQLGEMTDKRDTLNNENNFLRQRVRDAQDKLNSEAERNNVLNEHNQELRGQVVNLIDERDKAQAVVQILHREREQARAAFRALVQRMTFEDLCDLLLNWGTDK